MACRTIPSVPGIDKRNVVWVGDVDMAVLRWGKQLWLLVAGLAGCETALHLALIGKTVTIIDVLPADQTALNVHPLNKATLLNMLEKKVSIYELKQSLKLSQ